MSPPPINTIADGSGFPKLAEAAQFKLKSARRIGEEMFLVYAAEGGALRVSAQRAMSQSKSASRFR